MVSAAVVVEAQQLPHRDTAEHPVVAQVELRLPEPMLEKMLLQTQVQAAVAHLLQRLLLSVVMVDPDSFD